MLTVETRDLIDVLARATEAGFPAPSPTAVAASPYDGRRAAVLRGPAGERVEVVEAR